MSITVSKPAAIEYAVNDIAHSSCQDHCDDDYKGRGDETFADGLEEHPAEKQRHQDAETRKHILIDEVHSIGHAIVLDERQIEPRRHFYRLSKVEVRLDINLDNLIDKDKGQKEPNGQQALLLASTHYKKTYLPVRFSLASTLSVA